MNARIRRGLRRSPGALALLAALLPGAGAAAEPRIELEAGEFRVEGAPPDASPEQLQVRVEGAEQPMLGSAAREGDQLRFRPRFPLRPGVRYRVELRGETPTSAVFEIPRAEPERPLRVAAVYPSGPVLPANQLKLYVQFSRPAARGDAYARIELRDAAGDRVEAPFVEIEPELWDPSGTRLTLLFDPGRIKRGLRPNREVGPPLRSGSDYTLVLTRAWTDPAGTPLEAEYRRSFRVGPADREPPDPARWTLGPPAAGTREALVVELDEPLDHSLLSDSIAVRTPEGDALTGEVEIAPGETRWLFTPQQPWSAGPYRLRYATRLEDLAGNRIGRAFDVDLDRTPETDAKAAFGELPFQVTAEPVP